jgi:aquaporin Z
MDKPGQVGLTGGTAVQRFGAEFLGTALLVFTGVGAAVFALNSGGIIVVGLAFGLVMLALAYALAPVSGAHFNPAVTLGALLSRTISAAHAVGYWIAQVLGGILGAFVLFGLVRWGRVPDETGVLGASEYGARINAGGAMVLEFVLTFLFVLVVLLVTSRTDQTAIRGTAIGLALGLANLVAIRLDGGSINPARSIGPALFQGGAPLRQVWLFIVFPLLGGVAAALAARLFLGEKPTPGPGVDWRAMNVRTPQGRPEAATAGEPGTTTPAAGTPGRSSTTRPKRR